ncbi:MAG: tetratricopeptide repeat protein [Pseudomonadota bacterium]
MALNPTSGNTPKDDPKGKQTAEDEILIREIDEAVRKGDLDDFAKKYGVAVIGGIVAVLLAFGGYLFWDSQVESGREAESEAIVSALDQIGAGNLDAAAGQVADLANDGGPAARVSALFIRANAALEAGNTAEAVEIFGQIAADGDAPPALRDLATIREVATNFDDREPADVIARLKDLAVPGNPFFGSAAEMTAMAHLEAGDTAQAGTLFAEIAKSEDAPPSLVSRARQMAGLLGVDAIEDVDQLLEDEGISTGNDGAQVVPSTAE